MGFREEVENVSGNQRPGRPSCFSDRPENNKHGRGCSDLASSGSCQVSLNSVQHLNCITGEVENVSANKRLGRLHLYLVFPISPKNTNLVEDIEILLSVKFRCIPFSGFRKEVENASDNQRPGRPSYISHRPEKNKLCRGCSDLDSCQVSLNSVQRLNCIRGEVENVSANQRPGRPSCFSDRPEKHKLGRGDWDLAFCQVSLYSVQRFQKRSRKCLSQSEARAAI